MPSNNLKYTEEMRTQTAEFILNSGKSATNVAEEMGFLTAKPTSTQEIKIKMRDLVCVEKRALGIVISYV